MTVRKLDDGKPKLWLAEVYPQLVGSISEA